jgi:hypothetical protein
MRIKGIDQQNETRTRVPEIDNDARYQELMPDPYFPIPNQTVAPAVSESCSLPYVGRYCGLRSLSLALCAIRA